MRLGATIPNFSADTTHGPIKFWDWQGDSWCVIFSHPADFTPVCTTELGRIAVHDHEFKKRGVKIIAHSCDKLQSHTDWVNDIKSYCRDIPGDFPYPIIADPTRELAVKLDMIDEDNKNDEEHAMTVRALYIVGPDHKLKLSMHYPASTGRNVDEILRVIDSLQLTSRLKVVATPANWTPGTKVMILPHVKDEELPKLFPKGVEKCFLLHAYTSPGDMARFLKLNNGYSMPTVGLGTWQAGPGEVYNAVQLAIDLGYRHFDCAMLYGNEAEIGRAIRDKISKGDVKREDLFITSKLWNTFHRPDLVIPTCKKALQNFGMEYLDLYLIHWPISYKQGDDFWPRDEKGSIIHEYVDYLETWREMEKCVSLGLVRSIGLSNFNSQQIDKVLEIATVKPVNNQVECHVYLNQKKLISFCKDRDITVTAYSPLGAPNAMFAPKDFPILLKDEHLKKIAEKYNKTIAQLVLRYVLQNGASVIPKSTNEKRLRENIDIFNFNITPEDMALLDSFNKNARTCPFTESINDKNYPFSIEF